MLTLDRELLSRPVAETVRLLCRSLLDDAADSLHRLGEEKDAEALHDFRVALRRLRSVLRAYRPQLEDTVKKKSRRRLSELASATGAGRDAEVQLAWLETQVNSLTARQRPGAHWLKGKLEARKEEAYRHVLEVVADDFQRLRKRLWGQLGHYNVSVGEERGAPASFREALATLIGEQADDLSRRLGDIGSVEDDRRQHEARISAKRLRYLAEPLGDSIESGPGLVESLKEFQDLLGELNDAHLLRAELSAAIEAAKAEAPAALPGLRRLEKLAGKRAETLYHALEASWLQGRADGLRSEIEAVRAGLCTREEGVEIERKFLLRRLPLELKGAPFDEIDQGWIPGEHVRERVRRIRSPEGERYYRTLKVGNGLKRLEFEEETTRKIFEPLWRLTKGNRVRKRRYRVAEGALQWEVDKFTDRDLIIAEIELSSQNARVEIPPWLEPSVEREVTGDGAYYNENLAR